MSVYLSTCRAYISHITLCVLLLCASSFVHDIMLSQSKFSARFSGLVVLQHKLMSGRRLQKRSSAPAYRPKGLYGSGGFYSLGIAL